MWISTTLWKVELRVTAIEEWSLSRKQYEHDEHFQKMDLTPLLIRHELTHFIKTSKVCGNKSIPISNVNIGKLQIAAESGGVYPDLPSCSDILIMHITTKKQFGPKKYRIFSFICI